MRSIIGLAHNLDLGVIAEGVETAGAARQLHELGCEYAQGFLFAEPLDASGAESLLCELGTGQGRRRRRPLTLDARFPFGRMVGSLRCRIGQSGRNAMRPHEE